MEHSGQDKLFRRTDYCGELSLGDCGRRAVLFGWVGRRRDLGGLVFVTLRDRSGVIQCVFDEEKDKPLFDAALGLRAEYTVRIEGIVAERGDGAKNPKMPTGSIEVLAEKLHVFSRAQTPPFEIVENSAVNEALRLKYRYLDLRRPDLQRIIMLRHTLAQITRRFFDGEGFLEIETPMLTKSTPEGARDYLVPSRVHPGKFFALPQSPQQYKQLLMLAGFDRYFQLTRCLRDEDLRIDRQPEFTQVDIELSFAGQEEVMAVSEGYIKTLYKEALGIDISLPLPRLSYDEAMERFGSDKPDIRFGLELVNLEKQAEGCGFRVFEAAVLDGGSVRGVAVPGGAEFSRRELDSLTAFAKDYGAGGLAWIKNSQGALSASFAKLVAPETLSALAKALELPEGGLGLIVADKSDETVFAALGALRCECAKRLSLIKEGEIGLLWVTDFPMFEYSAEENRYVAKHHPFTAPRDEDSALLESAPAKVRAKAYDMVLNGFELGGGSVRIHDSELQARVFSALGFSNEELTARFGHLIEAFKYGAPPHGGIAFGFDRIVMLLSGAESIRDTIAFPKVQNSSELMMGSPDTVDTRQLNELHIRLLDETENP